MKVKDIKEKCFIGIILLMSFLIVGCQGTDRTVSRPKNPPESSVPVVTPGSVATESSAAEKGNKIALCQSELVSLKKVSPETYLRKKAYFDDLVSNATVYATVRSDVNGQTKETVDALYKYKINQICVEIARDVLQGLIRRGESLK
ncbi:hypothetical protein D3C75_835590 [compost metagenome]